MIRAGLRHDPGHDVHPMIQPGVVQQVVQGMHGAGLRIDRAIDENGNAGLEDGPGAHRARFQRDVERAAIEPPRSQRMGRLGDGDHLGVGRGIVELLSLIVGAGDHLAMVDNRRADGHFIFP